MSRGALVSAISAAREPRPAPLKASGRKTQDGFPWAEDSAALASSPDEAAPNEHIRASDDLVRGSIEAAA